MVFKRKFQADVFIELLRGQESHAAICNRYGISQRYLYKLRDRAMKALSASKWIGMHRDLPQKP